MYCKYDYVVSILQTLHDIITRQCVDNDIPDKLYFQTRNVDTDKID